MKLLLFGAGNLLKFHLQENHFKNCEVLAIIDNNLSKHGNTIECNEKNVLIISPEDINKYSFDLIVITVKNENIGLSILHQLAELNIDPLKIAIIEDNGNLFYMPRILDAPITASQVPQLYYDVSQISKDDAGTGIQRVVNNLYRNLLEMNVKLCPTQMLLGEYITCHKYHAHIMGGKDSRQENKISPPRGSKIIMPDWLIWQNNKRIFSYLHQNKIESFCFLYDLIPILLKDEYVCLYNDFMKWLINTIQYADNVICISQTVADDFLSFCKSNNLSRKGTLRIYLMHDGFDFGTTHGKVRQVIRNFVNKNKTILVVGANDPRKRHILTATAVLEVMNNNPRFDGNLLFIGRKVKAEEKLFKTMTNTCTERIMWVEDASDAELCYAYQNSRCLLYATISEGFGLPLAEAAHFNLPILASNLPIFRETAGDNILYFAPDNAEAIRELLLKYWFGEIATPESKNIRLYTWHDSAQEVRNIIAGKAEPYAVV